MKSCIFYRQAILSIKLLYNISMKINKLTLQITYLLFVLFTQKGHAFSLDFDFVDGPTVCAKEISNIESELSKWVPVPIDYSNSSSKKTLIYTYTKKIFNPKLTSVLYLVGGPGGSSRSSEFSLPNTNVIFFEQRGISCSRPSTKELFLNPKFYSSENTAHDALLILNAYGIKKAAIYGHSYGTVPATIFASKYPQRTKALVLEGVVYKADESLWIPQSKIKHIEDYFYSLTLEQQERILSFSEREDVPNTWFSFIARMTLGVGNFQNGLTGFLESTLFNKDEQDDASLAAMLSTMLPKVDTATPAEQQGYGEITMGMVACQEMNLSNPLLSHLLYFKNGHLIPDRNNTELGSMCVPLGLTNIKTFYSAKKYPIHVPVTYFLGEFDPATSLEQGLSHYNNAQSIQKQALIMKGGGHVSNLEKLIEAGYCDASKPDCIRYKQQKTQSYLFEKAVNAKKITDKDIELFNGLGTSRWMRHLDKI